MANKENIKKYNLSEEWVQLVKEAMESNITKQDFKQFLEEMREKRDK